MSIRLRLSALDVFFGKRTVYRFSIFSASERVTYDEKIMRRLRDNFLDRLRATGEYSVRFVLGESKRNP